MRNPVGISCHFVLFLSLRWHQSGCGPRGCRARQIEAAALFQLSNRLTRVTAACLWRSAGRCTCCSNCCDCSETWCFHCAPHDLMHVGSLLSLKSSDGFKNMPEKENDMLICDKLCVSCPHLHTVLSETSVFVKVTKTREAFYLTWPTILTARHPGHDQDTWSAQYL